MKKIILIKICLSLCMFSGINHNVIHSQQPVTKVSANPPDWELGGGWWSWDWCEDGWLDCDPGHHFELDEEIITSRKGKDNGHPWVECHPGCSCKYNGDGGNDVYTSWSAWWYELVNPYSPWAPWWGWSTDIGGGEGIDLGGAGGNSGGSGGGTTGSNEEAGDGTGGGIDGGNDGTIVIGDKDPPILPPATITVTDCAGVEDGTAYIDECGDCVGGETLVEPCEQDCNDEWGGTAYEDDCGNCVGGTTGLEACGPCRDDENNLANPLMEMALAPPIRSDGSINIPGARYGYTRVNQDGTPKFHNGIDLAGPVGTPIYAQFDGVFDNIRPFVTEQPNRVNGNYPVGYTGDRDGAGNRVYVTSTVGGTEVSFGYMHLQAGTPLANNPETGLPWQRGDAIEAGQVIGYIGITGNANPNVPHLHLSTIVNNAFVEPEDYLNATVVSTTTVITTPCDE